MTGSYRLDKNRTSKILLSQGDNCQHMPETRQLHDDGEKAAMPTKPETAAMSTAARQNRIEMAVGIDITPARAPTRPPATLAGGVANAFPVGAGFGSRANHGRRAAAPPAGPRRLVERERTLRKRKPF
jgi:hypothetical protein